MKDLLLQAAVIAASPTVSVVGAVVLTAPPIQWLPPASETRPLLGILLGAQAAVAALTLAVMIFVLQGVSSRRDADDRVSNEYIRRSWVHPIFWSSLGMVAMTGAVLLAEEFGSVGAPALSTWPGLPNLALLGAAAFIANLVLSGVLFERALRFVQPDRWRALRTDVNKRDVRGAVQAFLRRHRRVIDATAADELDWVHVIPGPGEGSADEAIRSLLDDALRAVDNRRHAEFNRALDSIKGLIEYAMGEIESRGLTWGQPGSQPEWPPLRELGSNLYTFREEVISRGNREHAFALLRLDYWLLRTGVRRRCGELFTVGLDGYRWSYEITRRVGGSDLRGMFRDRAWSVLPEALINVPIEEALHYMKHAVRQQERLLADAMSSQDASDFKSLMDGFSDLLRHLRFTWDVETRWPRSESADHYEDLLQMYRIALMGLGGRAVLLSESQTIAEPDPYLQAGYSEYVDAEQLAADVSRALADEERASFSLWSDWEMEDAGNLEVRVVSRERYPLTFFTIRLLELARDPMPVLDLGGRAQRVLDWFEENIEALQGHVELDPRANLEERRVVALNALRDAVRRDGVAGDEDIIGRKVNQGRLDDFRNEVRTSLFSANTLEQLFERAGAYVRLSSGPSDPPSERRVHQLIAKGPFTDAPTWAAHRNLQLGRSLEENAIEQLCEAVADAPLVGVALGSGTELLQAIDEALSDLAPEGDVIVVLQGDWSNLLSDLDRMRPPRDGYEPWWAHTDSDLPEPLRRYHGYPIIEHRGGRDLHLYIVELPAWGALVRAQVDGDTDLLIEVEEISAERAQELLDENPNHFSDQPDTASKLRKLQTLVEFRFADRVGFRVTDAGRARKVVPPTSE